MSAEIDTFNKQFVGLGPEDSVIVMVPRQRMTKREALVHAAWLVVLADDMTGEAPEFPAILAAVRNT